MWEPSGQLSTLLPIHHYVTLKLNHVTERMNCIINKNEQACQAFDDLKGNSLDKKSAEYEAWKLDKIVKTVKSKYWNEIDQA